MTKPSLHSTFIEADAWIFDFDDTLTDYERADRLAVESVRKIFCPHLDQASFLRAAADSRTAFYRSVAVEGPRGGLDAVRIETLFASVNLALPAKAVMNYQDALRVETVAAPGARALLERLATGYRLGVVTNAYDIEPQRARIAATGLADLLDIVVIAAEVGYFKPDRQIMWLAAEKLDVRPGRCVFVGDSVPFDIAAGRAAGMTTVLVGKESHPDAHLHVRDLLELDQLVAEATNAANDQPSASLLAGSGHGELGRR
ncbi:pyrimidine 5'-nucleotidase YjjG [mine drainage metagenome]|uniref:Pyrimidine 5'-nucleotidase YjjG n=1 Tax=mine drainage metagenome TaxID=410659 RepID=A0A1J5P7J7_9ZZZZ